MRVLKGRELGADLDKTKTVAADGEPGEDCRV